MAGITVGVRPEHIGLGPPDAAEIGIRGTCELVEYLGPELQVHLRIGSDELVVLDVSATLEERAAALETFGELYAYCREQGLQRRAIDAAHHAAIVAPLEAQVTWAHEGLAAARAASRASRPEPPSSSRSRTQPPTR